MKEFSSQRKIKASLLTVFHAIEDPALLAQWWGPAGFSCTFHTFAFKPQGAWTLTMHGPDGANYPDEQIFLEIEKPRKVVVRHLGQPQFNVTISLQETEGGTLLNWSQDFADEKVAQSMADIVKPANEQLLDKLVAVVGKRI